MARSKGIKQAQIQEMIYRYNELGQSTDQIAQYFEVTKENVNYHLRNNGVVFRSRGGANNHNGGKRHVAEYYTLEDYL